MDQVFQRIQKSLSLDHSSGKILTLFQKIRFYHANPHVRP